MAAHHAPSPDEIRALFPTGTVLHNPASGEWARVVEHGDDRVVGDLLAPPGTAVPGAHSHPRQTETFEVAEGVMGYRRGDERGELHAGAAMTVLPGVVHDWWNAGTTPLRARVTVQPPGSFAAMIASVWGLGALGRTNAKGMPKPLEAALLAEAFGHEIVFERPPRAVQQALARTVAPIARRRGKTVTGEVLRAAVVAPERWPGR